MRTRTCDIAVLPGDGIGHDVIEATVPLLEQAASGCGVSLRFATHPAGAHHYAATGDALPEPTVDACRAADAILFGWPRPASVTCVDKANVFVSMAFFRRVFDEVARRHPGIEARHHYVDATALDLIRRPWTFDVMVMENMFGDIISDQTAALVGGMGMAPSGDIGDRHGLFQPCHGSAPDIAGQGKANPAATLLSAVMMLDWLADRHDDTRLAQAAVRLERAVDEAFGSGRLRPCEFGGTDGTAAIAAAVAAHL